MMSKGLVGETEDYLVYAKRPSVSCENIQKHVCEEGKTSLMSPELICKNIFDLYIVLKDGHTTTPRHHDIIRVVLALVKGEATESLCEKIKAQYEDGPLESVEAVLKFRSNSVGWMSIVRIRGNISRTTKLKKTLFLCGLPLFGGKASRTEPLPGRGKVGMKLGCICMELDNVKYQHNEADLVLTSFSAIGKREQKAWDLTTDERRKLVGDVQIASSRVPLAHILGTESFGELRFKTSPNVFVPRESSLSVVNVAVSLSEKIEHKTALDLGCGTGCLILSFLKRLPQWKGFGVDVNSEAVELAKDNSALLNLQSQAVFTVGDYVAGIETIYPKTTFGLVLCNPPYLPSIVAERLTPNDPVESVGAGPDGMQMYCVLARLMPRLLHEGGFFVVEVPGNRLGKHAQVVKRFLEQGLKLCHSHKDARGLTRCLVFQLCACTVDAQVIA